MISFDVIVIGAGAAGLFCAIEAGRRGRSVAVIDHAKSPGEKIRISGGGRCNFTNLNTAPDRFISQNPHFCKSALARFTPADFIARVNAHGISWHEKTLGQLFCDHSSRAIIDLLLTDCRDAGVQIYLPVKVENISQTGDTFTVQSSDGIRQCSSLVIATGGKSIPKMGASDFAYRVAEQFGVPVTQTRPALVPLTFSPDILETTKPLSGVSTDIRVTCGATSFDEAMLFTHRGISGPSILQISSYWREGDEVSLNLAPRSHIRDHLTAAREKFGGKAPNTIIAEILPRRLSEAICQQNNVPRKLAECAEHNIHQLHQAVHNWTIKPVGSEGYRTAEVTLGGVDTTALSSKTMEVKSTPGLYYIGEAVDVTGWLGGYNFQWAWASGWAAGQVA